MSSSKVAIVVSQVIEKVELIAGGLWAAFFILVAISAMFDSEKDGVSTILILWILGLIGVVVVLAGLRRRKMRLEFRKYVAQLSVDPTGTLENMAAATGVSVDTVKKNLAYMIRNRFFPDAYIDVRAGRLILASMEQKVNSGSVNIPEQTIEYVTCHCPNCGGINKIAKGATVECDYCGSPIKGI